MPRPTARHLVIAAHRRLALWVVAVGAATAFLLGSTWRDLGHDLHGAVAARQGLQPVRLAAQVRLALGAHQPAAAAVLAGRLAEQSERLRRQRMADDQLAALALSLEQRRLPRALAESDELRHHWLGLLADIAARRITPTQSDLQHQLMIEQTFVITDLAAVDSRLQSLFDRAVDGPAYMLATRELPRLALALAPAAPAGAGDALGADAGARAQLERRVARALAHQLARNAERDLDLDELQALRTLQQQLGDSATSAAAASEPARQAALQASAAILARIDGDLAAAARSLSAERRLVGFVLALDALLVLAAATLVALRRARPAPGATGAAAAGSASGPLQARPAATAAHTRPAESQGPAHALLDRLRRPTLDADTASSALGPR